jgi:hypothetical protein
MKKKYIPGKVPSTDQWVEWKPLLALPGISSPSKLPTGALWKDPAFFWVLVWVEGQFPKMMTVGLF